MLCQVIGDLRDERQRRTHGAVAACFGSLSYDGDGACFECFIDVPEALHLADKLGAAAANLLGEQPGIAEREEHAIGRMIKRDLQHVLRARQRPRNEPDTELLTAHMAQLLPQVGFTAESAGIPSADDTETPCARDGGREAAAGDQRHRGTYDWIRNSESLREPRSHAHLRL